MNISCYTFWKWLYQGLEPLYSLKKKEEFWCMRENREVEWPRKFCFLKTRDNSEIFSNLNYVLGITWVYINKFLFNSFEFLFLLKTIKDLTRRNARKFSNFSSVHYVTLFS